MNKLAKLILKGLKKEIMSSEMNLRIACVVIETISEETAASKQRYADVALPLFRKEVVKEYDRWGKLKGIPESLKTVIASNRDKFVKLVEDGEFDIDVSAISTLTSKRTIKATRQRMLLWLADKDERFSGKIVHILIPEKP